MEENEEMSTIVEDSEEHNESQYPDKCPECGSKNIITDYDSKEIVCGSCGFVFGREMDKGPEWRAFTLEEKAARGRVGIPLHESFSDKGLSTSISQVDRDATGKKLPQSTRLQMWRLRKWQVRSRVHESIEKNLEFAMNELRKIADKLDISPESPLRDQIAATYRRALKEKLTQGGRSIKYIVAASFLYVFREKGIPRTTEEIVKASRVKERHIVRCYRLMVDTFEKQMPVSDPISYVSKITGKVGISQKTQGLAIEILRKAKQKRIPTGDPRSMAAAALYIACRFNKERIIKRKSWVLVTENDISKAAEVTTTTIRTRYKKIAKELNIIILK